MDPVSIAAVGWSVKIVGWVASAAISKLITKGYDYLGCSTTDKLEQLHSKILMLERVMEVVETSPCRRRLEKLFKELKTAFYEAEEILDAVEYHCLERQIQDGKLQPAGGAPPPKQDPVNKFRSAVAKILLLRNKESGMSNNKLVKSLKKIEKIINEAHQILEKLNLSSISDGNIRQAMVVNPTTTAVASQKVFGRDNDRDKIIAMLHEEEGDLHQSTSNGVCFSVIGIHGVSGSGKTTLAQFVYTHEKKDKKDNKEGHFDLLMWVRISKDFNVGDIFKELYEAASDPKVPCPQFNNLNALEEELERKLDGKRSLLVLDDVWCNGDVSSQELPKLLFPLKKGKRGSKILVTTRSKDALPDLCPGVRFTIMPITDVNSTAFFELFMHYALEYGEDQSMFQNIGAEIAVKLKGSPLAARTVGGILRRQHDVAHWRRVRDQDLFKVWAGPLWWSYYQLGEQARRCFAYCSIFPRRHRLYRDELVRLWMAEGFIRNTGEAIAGDMEDVGQEIFRELLSVSFLQPGGYYYGKECYLVHDLLHDLAEAVAGSDCFRIDNNTSQNGGGWTGDVPRDVRHLFVHSYDATLINGKILELGNLHTLIIYNFEWFTPVEKTVIESILKCLPKLRVLAMGLDNNAFIFRPNILSIPEYISKLKHLRYLAIRTDTKCGVILPSTLNKLYHLQVLDISDCRNLVLPCGDLINLRHVFSRSALNISNMGRLVSLETLPQFTVRNGQGHEAKQLRHLNRLRGRLHICGLENLKSREEALEVNLVAKERLTDLTLSWGDGGTRCSPEVEAEVLEGIWPPMGLEKLSIWCYEGSVYPSWMEGRQNGEPQRLQELWLWGWSQPGHAPKLEAFIHLHFLSFWECSWNALPENMVHLSSLVRLIIHKCWNIRSLPSLPQSLESFALSSCDHVFMMSCETGGHPNWQKLQHIPKKKIGRSSELECDENLESESRDLWSLNLRSAARLVGHVIHNLFLR